MSGDNRSTMLDLSTAPFPSDGDGQQRDIAFEMLRTDIVACRLAPGKSVTESELATRYAIGKAAIRAALVRLGERGWVRALSRRGYVIRPMTLRDIGEIFELRRIVEPAAARLAAGRADIHRLHEIDVVCGAGYVAGNAASEATFLQAHRQLHLAIVLASSNQRLAEDFRAVWDESERVIHHTGLLRMHAARLRHNHATLIAALAAGDGDAAAAAADEEIEHLHRLIVDTALRTSSMLVPAAVAAGEAGEKRVSPPS
jgi:DNA-binding GntR family transcriptional regulator